MKHNYDEFVPLELLTIKDLENQLALLERFRPELEDQRNGYWSRRIELLQEAIAERVLLLENDGKQEQE